MSFDKQCKTFRVAGLRTTGPGRCALGSIATGRPEDTWRDSAITAMQHNAMHRCYSGEDGGQEMWLTEESRDPTQNQASPNWERHINPEAPSHDRRPGHAILHSIAVLRFRRSAFCIA